MVSWRCHIVPQAIEDIARSMVEQAAEAVEAAQREAATWKERLQQTTNKIAQIEQRVCPPQLLMVDGHAELMWCMLAA